MKPSYFFMACGLAVAPLAVSADTVLLQDDFESYANQAALEAAWVPTTAGYLTFNNVAGQGAVGSDKFLSMPADENPPSTGVEPNSWRTFTGAVTHSPSDADPLNFSVYGRAANWGGTRARVGVRSGQTDANILDLGTNNGTADNKFLCRIVGWTGSPGYVIFTSGPDRTANTWFKLEAHAGNTAAGFSFEVDDVAMTETATGVTAYAGTPMAGVRFGIGNSANQPVDWDNVRVSSGIDANVSDWDLY